MEDNTLNEKAISIRLDSVKDWLLRKPFNCHFALKLYLYINRQNHKMMFNRNLPRVASLLLSEPFMLDPNFKRSVILLCEHNEEGTFGYVLNQPAVIQLSDVMEDLPEANYPLFIGGPVAQNSFHFIHKCPDKIPDGTDLGNGLFWGGNFETLTIRIKNKDIAQDEVKLFLGYSGWNPGQLDRELTENTWAVTNDYHPDITLGTDDENLWKDAIVALGEKYAHIANFPQNPMWN